MVSAAAMHASGLSTVLRSARLLTFMRNHEMTLFYYFLLLPFFFANLKIAVILAIFIVRENILSVIDSLKI